MLLSNPEFTAGHGTASSKKLRGPTYTAIIRDELAHWLVDEYYENPDVEVLGAARPGLMTTHGPVLMMSSPWAKGRPRLRNGPMTFLRWINR
jgi:hypothetical protein